MAFGVPVGTGGFAPPCFVPKFIDFGFENFDDVGCVPTAAAPPTFRSPSRSPYFGSKLTAKVRSQFKWDPKTLRFRANGGQSKALRPTDA